MNRKQIVVWVSGFFCIMLIWPFFSFAGEVNLPKTGQTTCYNANGYVIDCVATGQDGNMQAGVDWPEPRFENNGDGTITDHLTGLVWLKDAGCAGRMFWNDALAYCNNFANGSCDLTDDSVAGDWRLPNIIELESLVNAEKSNLGVWLNLQGFGNVRSCYYWSATTYAGSTGSAWGVGMTGGGDVFNINKSNSQYVWPVRAGQ